MAPGHSLSSAPEVTQLEGFLFQLKVLPSPPPHTHMIIDWTTQWPPPPPALPIPGSGPSPFSRTPGFSQTPCHPRLSWPVEFDNFPRGVQHPFTQLHTSPRNLQLLSPGTLGLCLAVLEASPHVCASSLRSLGPGIRGIVMESWGYGPGQHPGTSFFEKPWHSPYSGYI